MRKIKDPFFYNMIDRDDFRNAFVRAFTFRYDKYQENHMDMLDTIFDASGQYKMIGEFMCYRNGEDYFIHNTCNNVIVGWYKHFGRCNCVNVKDFTAKDLYQFFKELRIACYKAGMYHVATPEWRAKIGANEARRNDPLYRKQLMQKITMNSIYGANLTLAPSLLDPKTLQRILKARKEVKNAQS